MLRKLRSHIAHNVVGYIALFVALGGTTYAAAATIGASNIKDNAVHSNHIKDNEVRDQDLAPDSVGSHKIKDGGVGTDDLALHAVRADKVLDNTLTGFDIQDPARTIQLPLMSFADCDTDTGAPLDFTNGVDRAPDFHGSATDGAGFSIRFDSVAGTEDQDFEICTQLTVPIDYASGGLLILRAAKGQNLGADETLVCGARLNNQGALGRSGSILLSAASSTRYVCPPGYPSPLAPDNTINIYLAITSSTTMDTFVDLSSVEFHYLARQ
jgi:hypothetical protein